MSGRKLSRDSAHRRSLFRNQVTDLLRYEEITTTVAKAKEIRSLAEKIISLGKEGSLASRRRAIAFLTDESVVNKLFKEIAPRYADRAGGYTRLVRLGPRQGDAAELARLELVK
ncbi:MAG: 50S ribosomal protein L17 [Dehalococcoidia bacterium]|nr:50S ribosomal protein L17 [Dehalococcoidia bacterium]